MKSKYSILTLFFKVCFAISLSAVAFGSDKSDPFMLDKEKIKASISANKHEVRICYNQLVEKKKISEGKMVVEFEINDQSVITKFELNEKKSKLKDKELFNCVKEKFSKWIFPPSPKGQVLAISYPFMFKKN